MVCFILVGMVMKLLKEMMKCVTVVLALLLAQAAHAGPTLDAVKARGAVRCGVPSDSPGFGLPDAAGNLKGFSVDFCRSVAAAVLGDANKVNLVPLSTVTRFSALQSKEVDVLFRQTTISFARDTTQGFLFGPIDFHDSQGLMVPKKLNIKNIKDLDGAAVCLVSGSNSETTITNYLRSKGVKFKPVSAESQADLTRTFFAGRCDVFSSDTAVLAAMRLTAKNPDDYVILKDVIAKSPLAPLVRQGDDEWYNIIRWVVYAPIIAEEFGITSANVDKFAKESTDAVIKRFLGKEPNFSKGLAVNDDWAYQIVKQVGNYAQIFDRNVGKDSPLKLDRGINRLYRDGGVLYPLPF
jgi:general L-amino acid transport system substrate-binding protein